MSKDDSIGKGLSDDFVYVNAGKDYDALIGTQQRRPLGTDGEGSVAECFGVVPGVCPGNTPPANSHINIHSRENKGENKYVRPVVNAGVDTFELSINIDKPRDDFYDQIQALKVDAQNSAAAIYLTLDKSCSEGYLDFIMSPHQKRSYNYHFYNQFYHVMVWARGEAGFRPRVLVSIRSKMLQVVGLAKSVSLILVALESKMGRINKGTSGVMRVDLFVDILLDESEFTLKLLDKVICRAGDRIPYLTDGTLETLYIGSKDASVRCRMYDKLREREAAGEGRSYVESINLGQIGATERVIRVEFQLRSKFLVEFGARDYSKYPEILLSLWLYLTESWLRVVVCYDKAHPFRCGPTLWWSHIQNCMGKAVPVSRKKHYPVGNRPLFEDGLRPVFLALARFGALAKVHAPNRSTEFEDVFCLARDTFQFLVSVKSCQAEFRSKFKELLETEYKRLCPRAPNPTEID